jgi:hydrogenase-4 component B
MADFAGTSLLMFFVLCATGFIVSILFRGKFALVAIAWFGVLSSICVILAGAERLRAGVDFHRDLWNLNGFGHLSLHLDTLSAVFLVITGLVYLSCSLFTAAHLRQRFGGSYPAGRYALLYFALMASVILILVAGDATAFLLSWEGMSILTYLLVNYEQRRASDYTAGVVMLAMSEAGFLMVVVAFVIVGAAAPTFSFAALRSAASQLSPLSVWTVFLLGFLGFGVKAGLAPVNFWLPRAYSASPSAFVPVLAGVTLNLGFYGILRLNTDIVSVRGIGPGLFALILGSITALIGILYATAENDLKTMLAHSSIENAGIIVAGIGAFMVFRSAGNPVAAALALTAALYHVANHSVYKSLLYQGTGEIEAETGMRGMDKMGGLIRLMPALSAVFLVGCLAISAIPPFNGFVSEWLVLQSLLRSASLPTPGSKVVFALCGAILALTAALAVTCFVKTYAMTFLGIRRSEWSRKESHNSRTPRFSLGLLAATCLLLGILPTYVIPVLNRVVEPLAGASATTSLVPPFFTATQSNQQLPSAFLQDFHNLGAQTGAGAIPGRGLVVLLRGSTQNPVVFAMSPSYAIGALFLLLLVLWILVRVFMRGRSVTRTDLWAGGIPKLLPEMTYTATGFSNPVRVVFQAVFRPNIVEDTRETVSVHFRTAIRRSRDERHLVERLFFEPVGEGIGAFARFIARMHHGRLNAYVSYVVGFLLLVLLLARAS